MIEIELKYVRTRMRMRGSRKRLLRMRETSIFGIEREFDFLGGHVRMRTCVRIRMSRTS